MFTYFYQHTFQDTTQFLSANPEHEAAEILSGQYHLMRQYLDVLKYRVGDMGETTHALPPALEPFDKDVMFIKVNNNTIYALETSYIKTLLSWHEDTAQITRLFADEEFPTGTNGERKSLAEILLIEKDKWKQHNHQCWDGRPMRICCIIEVELLLRFYDDLPESAPFFTRLHAARAALNAEANLRDGSPNQRRALFKPLYILNDDLRALGCVII